MVKEKKGAARKAAFKAQATQVKGARAKLEKLRKILMQIEQQLGCTKRFEGSTKITTKKQKEKDDFARAGKNR